MLARQKAILDNVADIAWMKDREGVFIYVNESFGRSCGHSPESLCGKTDLDIWPIDLALHYREDDQSVMETGLQKILDEPLAQSNGRTEWIETIKTPFFHNGKVAGTIGIARNITERKKIQEALKESENRYRSLFDSASDAIFIHGLHGNIMEVNQAACDLLGYRKNELLNLTFINIDLPDSATSLSQRIKNLKQNGPLFLETVHIRKDGTLVPVELSCRLIDYCGGIAVISIARDISRRKEAEAMLKFERHRLYALLEDLPAIVYLQAPDYSIRFCNKIFRRVFGEPGTKPCYKILQERDTPCRNCSAQKVLSSLSPIENEWTRANGQAFRLFAYPFTDADGSQLVLRMAIDITNEKKLRQESEYHLHQIVQADRLASLGEVVAGVAHEINNPNTFITYNIPLLEDTWQLFQPIIQDYAKAHPEYMSKNLRLDELCTDMQDIIQAIKTGSERINRVVTSLKDFARLDESVNSAPVKIDEVIKNTMTIVGAQVRKNVAKINLKLADKLPPVQGHFQKLEQVIANILVNASHAIPLKDKGVISVTTKYIERLQAVVVQIEDNGTGMEKQVIDRIFDPFFTTRRESGGTGLGLSVSFSLIKEHNGRIGVLSRPGLGTRFSVFLPLDKKIKLNLRPSILCVDDNLDFLKVMETNFLKVENKVFEATSNPASVEHYLMEHPEVDIVLSDVLMPMMNGWELLEMIRRRFPLLQVILYSGNPNAMQEKPAGHEPDYFLFKPFEIQQLTEIINGMTRQVL
ncbi:MAG TPA: PAS domain S-box protein [Smithellaceae bacterium]|nr:PAS domain S-box protein [Smithellaceae bacterium]